MTTGVDDFSSDRIGMIGPCSNAAEVTPHDTNELAHYSRGIYCGGTGDLKVTTVNGSTVTFVDIAAGIVHPIRAKIIFSTGTNATSIVAVW